MPVLYRLVNHGTDSPSFDDPPTSCKREEAEELEKGIPGECYALSVFYLYKVKSEKCFLQDIQEGP